MMTVKWMVKAAWLLAAGTWLLGASTAIARPGPMQVEEPAMNGPKPPIQPEKDQASWKSKRSGGLTAAQQEALKARQERMEDMVALIRQKRRAIREARPEQRQALALELHNLILEKSQTVERGRELNRNDTSREGLERQADGSDATDKSLRVNEAKQNQLDAKARQLEHREEIMRQQEVHRQLIEEKLKQLEKQLEIKKNPGVDD